MRSIAFVRPSVLPFVSTLSTNLLNRLTFELELLCMCGVMIIPRLRLKVKIIG